MQHHDDSIFTKKLRGFYRKNGFAGIGFVVNFLFWVVMFIGQLRSDNCDPGNAFCDSVLGNAYWAGFITVIFSPAIWIILMIGLLTIKVYKQFRKNSHNPSAKDHQG